jgi:hypothetical protein
MSEQFWLQDCSILFNKDTFMSFVPNEDQTLIEKFNAITRFSIYFMILILLTSRNIVWLSLCVTMIGFIIYLQKVEAFKTDNLPKKCTMPTHNNPFMNFTVGDLIDNPNKPQACDIRDPEVNKEVNKHFNHNLYKNSFDIFDREINSRPWITMPVTEVVNKQMEFAEWLYGDTAHCKSAGVNCTKDRDLRFHKM